jgi:dephospho-CoA kinase
VKVIGLTGGIASGKSLVAGMLEKSGAVVIDADRLAREAVTPGAPSYEAIIKEFGAKILNPDRTIDRKTLGTIVFADPMARKLLEQITHPAIRNLAENRLAEERRKGTEVAFYMVPLLIEAELMSCVDEVWIVYVDEKTQLERLKKRDCIDQDEALRKIKAQMPLAEKLKFGKRIINNSGTVEETGKQVKVFWEELLSRIQHP